MTRRKMKHDNVLFIKSSSSSLTSLYLIFCFLTVGAVFPLFQPVDINFIPKNDIISFSG